MKELVSKSITPIMTYLMQKMEINEKLHYVPYYVPYITYPTYPTGPVRRPKTVEFLAWADGLNIDDLDKIDLHFKVMHGDNELKISEASEAVLEGRFSKKDGSVWSKIKFSLLIEVNHVENLHIRVYDRATSPTTFLGQCEISMSGNWLTSEKPYQLKNKEGELTDKNGKTFGNFYIGSPAGASKMLASAKNLKEGTDAYFEVWSNDIEMLYESDSVRNTMFPAWDLTEFRIPENSKSVLVKVLDSKLGKHEVLGVVEIPLNLGVLVPAVYKLKGSDAVFVITDPEAKKDANAVRSDASGSTSHGSSSCNSGNAASHGYWNSHGNYQSYNDQDNAPRCAKTKKNVSFGAQK